MDYVIDYEKIAFKVQYTFDAENPEFMIFAAQPLEMLDKEEKFNSPSTFLIYGRIEYDSTMHVGFRNFSFVITDELHLRIGKLYKLIREEFTRRYGLRK